MDTLENLACFPTSIYHIKRPDFLPTVRAVTKEHLIKCSTEPLHELYPVRMTETLHLDPRMADFCAFVGVTAGNILGEQGYAMSGLATYFTAMWCQEHFKHSAMEQHVHPGAQMVGFYFIDVPEGSSAATFYDPRAGKVQGGLPEMDAAQITYASNAFHFAPKSGLLMFANAWLPHAFTRHGSDEPIRFLHFNINVVEDAPEPAEVI